VKRLGAALALVVLAAAVLVAAGVGQGSPPKPLTITGAGARREIAAVGAGSPEVKRGEQLFDTHGCSDCHTMAAGGYSGRLGPRLDVKNADDEVNDIAGNITKPPTDDAGYEPGLMPTDFGTRLQRADIHALAVYIYTAAHAAKGHSRSSDHS
jgi:mono/diheme cytochrome c family protein